MVDATIAKLDRRETGRIAADVGSSACTFKVMAASEDALRRYAELADAAVFSPSQSPAWISAWLRAVSPDTLLVFAEQEARPVFGLALEVVRKGPFRVARLMGGSHANASFAPLRPGAAIDAQALVPAVARARPDVDLLDLERLLAECAGLPNPLLDLANAPSPNLALSVDLAGGFEAVLERRGTRKRKKHRAQARKLEAAGGVRVIEADTPEEATRLLDAFLDMKADRFREAGIPNVFASAEMRRFLSALFREALSVTPKPFVLHGLEVGGSLRAITGSSLRENSMTCEFGAIVNDELAQASPGDFLFFEIIEEACRRGLSIYDFGVGDEPYKRSWCDLEVRHRDVMAPLSAKGRLLAAGLRVRGRLVQAVKSDPRLWRLAKAVRRRAGGLSRASTDPD
jgi:CelD/BcsL family acetyltransferase involved in cellulose biosynthesis